MEPKSIFSSKTFWLNVVGALMFVLNDSGFVSFLHISPAVLGEIMAALNLLMRYLTAQPVTLTSK